MNKNDITYCLFTSTRGHFDRKDIYKKTVDNILNLLPAEVWGKLIAHIKISPGEESIFEEMKKFLEDRGFQVISTLGNWKHGNDGKDNSHQIEYIKDMIKVNSIVTTSFFFHSEDDWLIDIQNREFPYWLNYAQKLLVQEPNLVQVRIARFSNEFERINQLFRKHGINAKAHWVNDDYFIQNDWSNNPYLARTRDMRAALLLVVNGVFPQHSEHGVGRAMRLLGSIEFPLVAFNPAKIRCCHIGTKENEQDSLKSPTLEILLT